MPKTQPWPVKWYDFRGCDANEDMRQVPAQVSYFATLEEAQKFAQECYDQIDRAVHEDSLWLVTRI